MRTLSASFTVLQAVGLWAPFHFSSRWRYLLYKLYTYTVISAVLFYVTTGLIHLIQTCRSLLDFSNNGFRWVSSVLCLGKILTVVVYRKEILGMIETLETDPCLPRNEEESIIQNRHHRSVRNLTIVYGIFVNLTISLMISQTVLHDIPVRKLPRKAWLPYDYSHGKSYWLTYLLQVTTLSYFYLLTIGYDTLISGMFLEISTKLTILQYRFTNLHQTLKEKLLENDKSQDIVRSIEKDLITDCVVYHLSLVDLSSKVIATFGKTIFIQYVLSAILLCLILYTISGMKLNASGFLYVFFYLCMLLIAIFLFCSCANQVTIECENIAESLYSIDWMNFSKTAWQSAIIIGCQSRRPITFTTGYFVPLTLDSFKGLTKAAYSIYNALQSLH